MIKVDNKRGLTLAELLVGIIVAGIVVLMISALGTIAYQSYYNLRNQSGAYNDSQYALQLIREAVRQSTVMPTYTVANNCLTITTAAAGTKYFYTTTSGATAGLYHGSNGCPSSPSYPVITGVTGLVFTACNSTTTPCNPVVTGQLVQVTLKGTKNKISFNYLISATGRTPW